MTARHLLAVVIALLATACSAQDPGPVGAPTPAVSPSVGQEPRSGDLPRRTAADRSAEQPSSPRPLWLGQRPLPLRPDGYGEVQPTPPELRDRRLPPPDLPAAPLVGDGFRADVATVPDAVIERSTWTSSCPVSRDDLRYVRLTFWGFDGQPHTGELLIHRQAADPLVEVFETLYRERFPIEDMHVVSAAELEAPATGDGNNTTAFVCRPTVGASSWSQHAYGLAVDVNPFHNPYVRGDLVLPELASAYTDRQWMRPGMVREDGPVVEAFAAIGWEWGGHWTRPLDPMHFSATGR